jgi:hypothetical protein
MFSVALDLIAACAFPLGARIWFAYALVLALHVAGAAPLLFARRVPWSQRSLLAAFAITLPVVGAPTMAYALMARGRPALLEEMSRADLANAAPDPALIRRLADTLPAPEVLMVGDPDDRRALLSALARRADGRSVALLRWALTATSPDVGMEAALALEDMSSTFEKRLVALRKQLGEAPSRAAALVAADLIMRAVESQMIEPSRIGGLAAEARKYYAQAGGGADPAQATAVALGSARLELALLQPEMALAVLDQALPSATPDRRAELTALREDALLATHRLPWEGSSLLRSYRPAVPRSRSAVRPGLRSTSSTGLRLVTLADEDTSAQPAARQPSLKERLA